jgi:hypothetical protein
LHITSSQPSHSGIYFCGGDTQWSPSLCGLSQNLHLGHRCSVDTGILRHLTLAKMRNLKICNCLVAQSGVGGYGWYKSKLQR